jgi:hypothetical protein
MHLTPRSPKESAAATALVPPPKMSTSVFKTTPLVYTDSQLVYTKIAKRLMAVNANLVTKLQLFFELAVNFSRYD